MKSAFSQNLKAPPVSFRDYLVCLVKQAVVVAFATVVANPAHAIDVSNYIRDAGVTNVYVSNITSKQVPLEQVFIHTPTGSALAICDATAGSIDVYSDVADGYADSNIPSQLFIYCTPRGSLGLQGNVALFSGVEGLDEFGLEALIAIAKADSGAANTSSFVDVAKLVDTSCDAPASGQFNGAQAYTFHGHCIFQTIVPNVVITGAISDVEAPLVGIAPADAESFLTAFAGLAVVWAVPVNLPFYRALQTSQGLANTDVASTVPSLTHAQIAAIYSQQITDPAQIVGTSGTPIKTPGSVIGICRQVAGSGSEAAAEAQWLGEGCGASDLSVPFDDSVNVFSTLSTGRVEGCLRALDQGGAVNTTILPAAGRFAIGIASSENGRLTWGPANGPFAETDVRVIAVDGALPTLENVVNGSYPFFSEAVLYNITSASLYRGNSKAVWEAVKVYLGAPDFLRDHNIAFINNYWGQSGDLALPLLWGVPATIPATATSVQGTPINALTKSPNGNVNTCDPAVLWSGSNTATYQFLNH